MNNTAPPAPDGSVALRFRYARSRLAGAQKSTASTPAYLRFVNRKAGGVLAAAGYALRLTPTQLTVLSSAVSFAGIAVLVLRESSVATGVVVSLLLLLGYALDSADGQLARVRGGGSKAGEWLDHVADIAKLSSLHSAVAIAMLRYFELDSLVYLAVPVAFLVANVTQYFGMMLRDKLLPATPAPPGRSSLLVAWLLQPLDHGSLALAFLVLGMHTLFLWCYGFLALCTVVFSVRSLIKTYRRLLDAQPAAAPTQATVATAHGAVPAANGPVPNGPVPNGTVPNGSVPNGSVPNGTVPNGTVPAANGAVPAAHGAVPLADGSTTPAGGPALSSGRQRP